MVPTRAPAFLQPPLAFGVVVCYIVFGPMLGCIICLTQRTRREQVYGSVLLLGFRMKHIDFIVLGWR